MTSRKGRGNGIEILIAEDSPTQAAKLKFLLEEHGYTVTSAADGKRALEAARKSKPALIVSDVVMPEMDGFELCAEIKRDDELKDVPVVLLTTLADVRDIMQGLECGADNFIRKPYEASYLLARVDYLLMNHALRADRKMQLGVEIYLGGQKHFITAERKQIVDLLISVYEDAVHLGEELKTRQRELADSNSTLTSLYHIAKGLCSAMSERDVCERALEHAMDIPGMGSGWIFLQDKDVFRIGAARNLPDALSSEGTMEGLCECKRRLLSGDLKSVANIVECECLSQASDAAKGRRSHLSVPLWSGDRSLGVINLVRTEQESLKDNELETLYGVGHQVAAALERAWLHEHLEQLVDERTRALTDEIAERKRAEKRFHSLFEFAPDAVVMIDQTGIIVLANCQAEIVFGYQREHLLGQHIEKLMPSAFQRSHVDLSQGFLGDAMPWTKGADSSEWVGLRKDGTTFPVDISLSPIESEGAFVVAAAMRDVTQRKVHEARIARLNRIYSVLSEINTTIVRVRDHQHLFDESCRIAVEHGKFAFAWIGTRDVRTHQVTPVAMAGHDDGYLSRINLCASEDTLENCTLTALALARRQPVICNDIAADEITPALRKEALSRGYRSAALLPLMLEDRSVGVLAIYAPEVGVFDAEEMPLLLEIAGDISFALDHLEKKERLDYLAYYDAITSLPNRTLFLDRVAQKINAARRDNKVFSIIVLDINRFSSVNETLGRQAGDDLLRQLTRRLQGTLRETDILARFSADYFGIATSNEDESGDMVHLLEKMLSAIQNRPFLISGQELRISARAGISSFPADGKDIEPLFHNAESALKKTQLSGDKYLFYTPAFNILVAEKLSLENKLRHALEKEELVLHYQPKIDIETGMICGLEALLRWNDPKLGLVLPLKFIPLLEETGMILEAGLWALEKAMSDSLIWKNKGLRPPRIAVNVSPRQLQQSDFVSMIQRVVKGDHEVAERLELEITESLVMRDIVENIKKLQLIGEMGVEVAVDDFGTGYSSLSYIAKLPVGTLKIDQSFIDNLSRNSDDLNIVSTIISLAHSLKMRVVAEGVETKEQLRILRTLKCDEMQGFLFSPAVPAEKIEQFLREKKGLPYSGQPNHYSPVR